MRKRFVLILLVVVLIITGCNSPNDANNKNGDSNDVKNIRIAGQSPEDHPSTLALYDFAEEVEEETDGRVSVDVYPANQLGDYTTVFEELGSGTIEMALIGIPGDLDKRLELIFTPYMVTTYEGIEEHYDQDSFVFNKLQEITNELGIQLLGFHANGFGGIGTVKSVDNLLDLGDDKDLLLRTAPMDVYQEPMKDIGFRTVTIPFADLYTALQTGAADGWSGGEPSLNYFGYRDVINHFYQTNDFFNADSLLINKDLYDQLDEDDVLVIDQAAEKLMENSFQTAEEYDAEYRDLMEEEGIEVVTFTDEELEKIAEFIREATWPKIDESLGDNIISELKEEVEN